MNEISYWDPPKSDSEASEMSWLLKDNVAIWNQSKWTTQVDLRSAPIISVSCPSTHQSLKLSLSPHDSTSNVQEGDYMPVGDCYVRQGDLVASFPEKHPFHFGFEAYFCAMPSEADHQILEVWLSVQTSKLESNPQLRLRLQSTGTESTTGKSQSSRQVGNIPGVYSFRESTLGIMIHPLDQSDTVLEQGNDGELSIVTFGRFMEKGVIRRMRLRIVASNGTISESQWDTWMKSFSDSPLPLTT